MSFFNLKSDRERGIHRSPRFWNFKHDKLGARVYVLDFTWRGQDRCTFWFMREDKRELSPKYYDLKAGNLLLQFMGKLKRNPNRYRGRVLG